MELRLWGDNHRLTRASQASTTYGELTAASMRRLVDVLQETIPLTPAPYE